MNQSSGFSPTPIEILQNLIRFDSTNPPGDEAECIQYLNSLLTQLGVETQILSKFPRRANLIARLKGRGEAPPFLMYGHVDVVTTANQEWSVPPFEGLIKDGFLWGRGALDMKGGVAMMVHAFLRAKAENLDLPGDVILAAVADEEAGGAAGVGFLCEEHADLFTGVRYAIGEFGGFNIDIAGKKFYPIQVAEKQICWMKATLHGAGGHGSMILRGGAMAKLGRMLTRLDKHPMPVHITPPVRMMFNSLADQLRFPARQMIRLILNPSATNYALKILGEEKARIFAPLVRNTANATILRASDKVNVIPSKAEVEIDGRLLPGLTPEHMLADLRAILGDEIKVEVLLHQPCAYEPDMGMFETLGGVLREMDGDGIPMPLVLPAVTDARFFYRIGIQTYGFTPMQIPKDFDFMASLHAADERVPVEALDFGAEAIYRVLGRFH